MNLLLRPNYVSAEIAEATRRYMEKWNRSSFHALLEIHFMNETDLANKIAEFSGTSRILDLKTQTIDLKAARRLPFAMARQCETIAIGHDEFNPSAFTIVMADPTRSDYIQKIREIFKQELVIAVAERSEIIAAVNDLYPLGDQLPGLFRV